MGKQYYNSAESLIYIYSSNYSNKYLATLKTLTLISLLALSSFNCQKRQEPSFNDGMYYFKIKDYKQAIVEFNRLIKNEPRNEKALYYRGVSYTALKEIKLALEDFNKAVIINPNYGKAFYAKGIIELKNKKYKNSFWDLQRANDLGINGAQDIIENRFPKDVVKNIVKKRLHKDMVSYYYSLGEKEFENKNYKEAINNFSDVLTLQPKNTEAIAMRATALERLNKYYAAIKEYSKAIEIDDKFKEAYFGRAVVYIRLKNYKKACEDLSIAEVLGIKLASKLKEKYCGK